MGNDMFNDEQLAHAEILQKETEDALGFWKDRALKAEAKLADKYLIEEQYEAACGDRDGLLRMVETLRGQKDRLEAERDALLSRARETDGAVSEAAAKLNATGEEMARLDENNVADSFAALHVLAPRFIREAKALLSALSFPPRPDFIRCALPRGECCHQRIPPVLPLEAPECNDGDDCCRYCGRGLQPCGACKPTAPPADAATEAVREAKFGACGRGRCRAVSRLVCDSLCRDCEDAVLAATPAPAPSADRCAAGHDWIRRGEGSCGDRYVCLRCGERKP